MCKYCNPDSGECNIFSDDNSRQYLVLQTGEWSDYYDDFMTIREHIYYCPYCGRKLIDAE